MRKLQSRKQITYHNNNTNKKEHTRILFYIYLSPQSSSSHLLLSRQAAWHQPNANENLFFC